MWKSLIVCNDPPQFPEPCGFSHLILLAQNLITDLIIISTFLATAGFAYAGLLLLVSAASEEKRKQAHSIFKKVGLGYLWILGAWLLVYTITSVLLNPGFSIIGAPR